MPLSIPAIRFNQKKTIMYLTALPIEELDICSIDRWDPKRVGKWKGYQRGLVKKKILNLAAYLERPDGILPVAGLLNVRHKNILDFAGVKGRSSSYGMLKIPDETRLWVVDMQHRLEGIKIAHSKGLLKNFRVPVLITEGLSEVDEAAQFYVINTRARKMGVDLTRRLLIEHEKIEDISDVPPWELKAVQICIHLNKKIKGSPWHNRIREPEAEKMTEHIASEKSFVPSLNWFLNSPAAKNKSPRHLARFLAKMWKGIQVNIPQAFEMPRSHVIQKTPGYMAFHRLAPILYRKYRSSPASTFIKIFKPLSGDSRFGYKFWQGQNLKGAKRYGTGQSAFSALAADLKKALGI